MNKKNKAIISGTIMTALAGTALFFNGTCNPQYKVMKDDSPSYSYELGPVASSTPPVLTEASFLMGCPAGTALFSQLANGKKICLDKQGGTNLTSITLRPMNSTTSVAPVDYGKTVWDLIVRFNELPSDGKVCVQYLIRSNDVFYTILEDPEKPEGNILTKVMTVQAASVLYAGGSRYSAVDVTRPLGSFVKGVIRLEVATGNPASHIRLLPSQFCTASAGHLVNENTPQAIFPVWSFSW